MMDERTRRRADFVAGAEIRLADGGRWTFPMPDDILNARGRGPDGSAGAVGSFGPGYEAALEAIREAEDDADALRAELALAICLLRRNYDLGPEDFAALLRFDDREALARMQQAMSRVASAHLRSFRAERRRARGIPDSRFAMPTPIGAFTT